VNILNVKKRKIPASTEIRVSDRHRIGQIVTQPADLCPFVQGTRKPAILDCASVAFAAVE